VALLARRPEPLQELAKSLRDAVPNSVFEGFPTDTSPKNLAKAFEDIKSHKSFKGLKLRVAIFSVKHSHRKPFMEESYEVGFFSIGLSRVRHC
jgi:short-subunit dehydrogenase